MVKLQEIALIAITFIIAVMMSRMLLGRRKLIPRTKASRMARYIRISKDRPTLEVAEVQVYDVSGVNIAPLYADVSMSSVKNDDVQQYGPNTVVDGNISGSLNKGELATTKVTDPRPTIELDLRHDVDVTRITLYLRDLEKHPNPDSAWVTKYCKNTMVEVLGSDRSVRWRTVINTWQRMYDFPLKHL